MSPKLSPPCWRDLLWFLTVQWRWPALYQRQLLEWWQARGWEAGRSQLSQFQFHLESGRTQPWLSLPHWEELWQGLLAPRPPDTWPWVTLVDPEFPTGLRTAEAAPTVLWSNLPWEKWEGPSVTVVGSRRCSAYGRLAVQQLVPEFAVSHQALIISGGAWGIDQAAHDAAVHAGQPTWVVLGCGLDHLPNALRKYVHPPARLVSPFPPGDPPEKWRFPARNRVMAQLANGVLIIEAAQHSGSLITAAAALEYGKEVMVVLPPFTSPNAAGALELLRQGAVPVTQAADIATALGLSPRLTPEKVPDLARSAEEKQVLQYLLANGGQASWGRVLNSIMTELRLERATAQSIITALELRGALRVEFGMILLSGMIRS